jgi:hypothetical protein
MAQAIEGETALVTGGSERGGDLRPAAVEQGGPPPRAATQGLAAFAQNAARFGEREWQEVPLPGLKIPPRK